MGVCNGRLEDDNGWKGGLVVMLLDGVMSLHGMLGPRGGPVTGPQCLWRRLRFWSWWKFVPSALARAEVALGSGFCL